MWTTRNIALLAGGGVAIAAIAFLGGRRVESEQKPALIGSGPQAATLDGGGAAPAPVPAVASGPSPLEDAGPLAPGAPLSGPASPADLFTKLEQERSSRPKLEPTAETVFSAMQKKLGSVEDDHHQVAGFVVGARYCDKIRTKSDVHVVVCEFTDEAAALKGLEYGASTKIKGREVLRNKATTCSVHQTDENKTSAAEAAKIKALFKTL